MFTAQICEHMTRRLSPVSHDSCSERGRLSPPSLLNDISGGSQLPPAAAVMREEKSAKLKLPANWRALAKREMCQTTVENVLVT